MKTNASRYRFIAQFLLPPPTSSYIPAVLTTLGLQASQQEKHHPSWPAGANLSHPERQSGDEYLQETPLSSRHYQSRILALLSLLLINETRIRKAWNLKSNIKI
jgi:hypothetical protein